MEVSTSDLIAALQHEGPTKYDADVVQAAETERVAVGRPVVILLATAAVRLLPIDEYKNRAVRELSIRLLLRRCSEVYSGILLQESRVWMALNPARDGSELDEHLVKNAVVHLQSSERHLRQMCDAVEGVARSIRALEERLAADRHEISSSFGVSGSLHRISIGRADPHNGGQVPLLMHFTDGEVVYKPRSLFGELLWSNLTPLFRGTGCELFSVRAIDRTHYGWMEYVAKSSSDSPALYYNRLGQMAYIGFRLGGTDFHSGNICATANRPVPVDLETILSPVATDWANNTILSTEIPRRPADNGAPDMSAFSAGEQAGIVRSKLIVSPNQRGLPEVASLAGMSVQLSAPVRKGGAYLSGDIESFTAGVRIAAEAFSRIRGAVADSVVSLCCEREGRLRVVLRDTALYCQLLDWLLHPAQCSRRWDTLYSTLYDVLCESGGSETPSLVCYEVEALLRGDVPFFWASANGRSLFWDGGEIERFFPKNALDNALDGINGLSVSDAVRQIHVVKLADSVMASNEVASNTSINGEIILEDFMRCNALPVKPRGVVDWIRAEVSRALGCVWMSDHLPRWMTVDQGRITFQGTGWYDGLEGTLIGLSAAREFLDADAYSAVEDIFNRCGDETLGMPHLCAALELSPPMGTEDLQRFQWAEQARGPDRVGGMAESIVSLELLASAGLRMAEPVSDVMLADVIRHQLSSGRWSGGWSAVDGSVLGGLSHGASGVAFAMSMVARRRLLNSTELDCLEAALHFESRLWEGPAKGWRDLRSTESSNWMGSWCHGAAGVGLARLALIRCNDPGVGRLHDTISRDIDRAIQAITDTYQARSLCCGELGRLLFLYEAQREGFSVANLASRIDAYASSVVAVQTPAFMPSLMKGDPGLWAGLLHLLGEGRTLSRAGII